MGALKQKLIRERDLSGSVDCPVCERDYWRSVEEAHYFEQDVASKDPKRDPTHREATGAEWLAWVLEGGRDSD